MIVRKAAAFLIAGSLTLAAVPAFQTGAQAAPTVTLNGTVHVVKADIMASNGVIHVIDGVLLPPSMTQATMAATMSGTMSAATMSPAMTMAATMSPAMTMAATMAPAMTMAPTMSAAATMSATMAATSLPTIADVVAGNPDFSTLLAALKAANLADTFAKPGTFTVFAPTNEAFAAAFTALNITPAQALALPNLASILTYHVAGTVIKAADLVKLTSVTTLNGATIAVSVSTGAATMAAAMNTTTVTVAKNATVGSYLVGPNGLALYTFKKDTAGSGTSACTGGCSKTWPALTVTGTPTAGAGITGKLDTIKLADGTLQVTYNGLPLYNFVKDTTPTDINGQGVGNNWYVAAP